MRGQLWQECSCGAEPVCVNCERCERHCSCEADQRQRRALAGVLSREEAEFMVRHAEESAAEV